MWICTTSVWRWKRSIRSDLCALRDGFIQPPLFVLGSARLFRDILNSNLSAGSSMPGIQNGRVCTLWRCNDKILGLGGFWSAPPLCLGQHGTAGRKGLLTMFSRRKRISLWGTLLALVLYAVFTLTLHTSRILSVVHSADPESVFPLWGSRARMSYRPIPNAGKARLFPIF